VNFSQEHRERNTIQIFNSFERFSQAIESLQPHSGDRRHTCRFRVQKLRLASARIFTTRLTSTHGPGCFNQGWQEHLYVSGAPKTTLVEMFAQSPTGKDENGKVMMFDQVRCTDEGAIAIKRHQLNCQV